MSGMIRALLGFYQHIVDINLHGTAEQRSEHFHHQPLISGPCILQSEGHHIIAIQSVGRDENVFSAFGGCIGIW